MNYSYLFGPVPSRRLGLSLGIDLIPFKTCSFNCSYCECGATTNLFIKPQIFVATETIISEIEHYISNSYKKNPPDYITFAGSGEPTLASNLKEVITYLKSKNLSSKIAVLTNTSLINHKKIRETLALCDLVVPSLDAVLTSSFKKINNPHPDIYIENIIQGLIEFRKEYSGNIFLEIFIIPNLNDSEEELKAFKKIIEKIKPNKIQLNSLDRPGTISGLEKAPRSLLEDIKSFWGFENTEIVSSYFGKTPCSVLPDSSLQEEILRTIKRRPCTGSDLAQALNARKVEVFKILDLLESKNKVKAIVMERGIFYSAQ